MNRILNLTAILLGAVSTMAAPVDQARLQVLNESGTSLLVRYQAPANNNVNDDVKADKLADPALESTIILDDGREIIQAAKLVAVPRGCRAVAEVVGCQSWELKDIAQFGDTRASPDQRKPLASRRVKDVRLTPENPVSIGKVEIWRGIPVAPLCFYPLQLDADGPGGVENAQLEVRIRFEPDPLAPSCEPVATPPHSQLTRLREAFLLNPPPRDEDEYQRDFTERILILHQPNQTFNADSRAWMDSLANWKRQIGFWVDTAEVPNLNAADIRNMVRNRYYHGQEFPISYLIFFASDSIEQELFIPPLMSNNYLGDHWYSLMDDRDFALPDIMIGRINALNRAEMRAVVKRTIRYEREPYLDDPQWFTRGIYTAENIAAQGGQFVPSMIHLGRWISMKLRQNGWTRVDTFYYHSDGADFDSDVRLLLEDGRAMTFSRGWLDGCYDDERREGAATGRKNPFVIAATCLSYPKQSNFYRSATLNDPRGSIAATCFKGFSHTRTNNCLLAGAIRGFLYFNLHSVGAIVDFGKWQMWMDNQYDFGRIPETLGSYRLMGDPSTMLWTAVPTEMTVVHPQNLTPGASGLNVQVTQEGEAVGEAVVCLQQAGGLHLVARPGNDGGARFNFDQGELRAGVIGVTVTAPNKIPYFGSITVAPADIMLDLTQVAYNNQDNLFSNGEQIRTTLTFRNSGRQAAAGVVVRLSTEDDWITFSPNQINLGNIAANAAGQAAFDLVINRNSPADRLVRVFVLAGSGEQEFPHTFTFTSSGFLLNVIRTDSPDNFTRGQSPRIVPRMQNNGDLACPALNATLISLDEPWITLVDSTATFGALNANGGLADAAGGLRVNIHNGAIPGNLAHLGLILRAQNQDDAFTDTVYFTRQIGEPQVTDPYGPDEYGYVVFDSFDQGWEKRPVYEWIEINPDREDCDFQGIALALEVDSEEDFDTTVAVQLPFEFQYYGQDFDVLAVNSNGWAAFGEEQAQFPNFRNQHLPGIEGPDAQIAVLWQDQINPTPPADGVFYYYIEQRGLFVVEWSGMEVLPSDSLHSLRQEYQLILYNPAQWPTSTGDGEIKLQYKTFHNLQGISYNNFYYAVGLKNLDNTGGLEYCYWDHYPPACRRLENRMALLFTTEREPSNSVLQGRVYRSEDHNQYLEGVQLRLGRSNARATSDVRGNFIMRNVPAGQDWLIASKPGFNDTRQEVVIPFNDTIDVEVAITHPDITVFPETIRTEVRPGPYGSTVDYYIRNTGNGPLEFNFSTRYPDGSESEYNPIWRVNGSAWAENDFNLYGCELIGDLLYISGGKNRREYDDNTIYVFNRQGELIRQFLQPSSITSWGFRDLAWDGTLLYGGERETGVDSLRILGIDLEGHLVRTIWVRIPENSLGEPWGLAYCPEDSTFWTTQLQNDIFQINLQGQVVGRYSVELVGAEISSRGLAWNSADPEGLPLYIMHRGLEGGMTLVKYNPESDDCKIAARLSDIAGPAVSGLSLGYDWERSRTCLAVINGASGNNNPDTLIVFEIGPDDHFLRLHPASGSIRAGRGIRVGVEFRGEGLSEDTYRLSLLLTHNAAAESYLVPVTLVVNPRTDLDNPPALPPNSFQLDEAHPNPFNSSTLIGFSIPEAGAVNLSVYDLSGRMVASLVDDQLEAGRHSVLFEAQTISAGLYFYRLKMGAQTATQRLVVIK